MPISVKNNTFRWLTTVLTPGPAAVVARILWPIMLVLDDLGLAMKRLLAIWSGRSWKPPFHLQQTLQNDYNAKVIPERAQRCGVIERLLHAVLRRWKIMFVVNIAAGMGHNTVELDLFFRLLISGMIDNKNRYVLLRLPGLFHDDTLTLYRRRFWKASNSTFLYNVLMPTIARFSDIRLDCGLSRLKWHLREDGSYETPPEGQSFLHQVDKSSNREAWRRYYKLRQETRSLHPLRDNLPVSHALREFLEHRTEKLALIHVKFHVANATPAPSDPQLYIPTIRWLQAEGYRVIMIGREVMPPEFHELGVINYAQSSIASYCHDLELVGLASIVVTAGSGIAFMPDCMGNPMVYLDSWHLGMPMASGRCILVPALVVERGSGEVLTITEELDLYWSREDKGDEIFPRDAFQARLASADEVLEAVKEALELDSSKPLTPLQQRYREITHDETSCFSDARISEYFVRKHSSLFEGAREHVA